MKDSYFSWGERSDFFSYLKYFILSPCLKMEKNIGIKKWVLELAAFITASNSKTFAIKSYVLIKFTICIELLNMSLKAQSLWGVLGSQGMAAGIHFGDSFL